MIKDKKVVKCSNKVARSAQKLSVLEQRIVYSAVAQTPADKQITCEDEFYLSLDDLHKLGGATSNDTYQQLKNASINLMRRLITLAPTDREDGMTWVFPWCQAAGYNEQKGMIAIRFSYNIIPYLKEAKERFIQYNLEEITGFRSVYTQPLYSRLLLHMRDRETGRVKQRWSETIPLDELKPTLNAETYEKFYDLKRKVLDIATKQINESPYTRYKLKWSVDEKSKVGKRVTAIRFDMVLKPHVVDCPDPDLDTIDISSGLTRRQATLSDEQIEKYADFLTNPASGLKREKPDLDTLYLVFRLHEYLLKNYKDLKRIDINTDMSGYKKWMQEKLADPDFVHLIYKPFLKQTGFDPDYARNNRTKPRK